jgi:hypothetical protein
VDELSTALTTIRLALEAERERALALDGALQVVLENWERARRHRVPDFRVIYNVALYVLLFDRDFSVLKVQMFEAQDRWSRQFIARQMAVALAELCGDLPKLLGKSFRAALARLEVPASIVTQLDAASAAFHEARRRHEPRLRAIRNGIGAHRETDAIKHVEALVDLDPLEVYGLAPDFYVALEKYIGAKTALVAYLGQPAVILRQLSRREPAV